MVFLPRSQHRENNQAGMPMCSLGSTTRASQVSYEQGSAQNHNVTEDIMKLFVIFFDW